MKKYIRVILLALVAAALPGCKATYPRERLTDAVRQVVKKEYNLDSTARLVGDTLYLNIRLTGMTSTEPKALAAVMKKVQGAVLAVTRVSLSSDAPVHFMVVSAHDPSWKLGLRIIQRLDDVKAYFYQKISRSDYENRLVLEINNKQSDAAAAPDAAALQPIGIKEFIGRLVVSQVNMLSRSNPFLSVILGNAQLEFCGLDDDELVIRMGTGLSSGAMPLFDDILGRESKKTFTKYGIEQPKRIRIIDHDNRAFLITIPR